MSSRTGWLVLVLCVGRSGGAWPDRGRFTVAGLLYVCHQCPFSHISDIGRIFLKNRGVSHFGQTTTISLDWVAGVV